MAASVDVPGVKPGEAVSRAGYEIFIPGECLKPGSRLWTDEQRASGVWVRLVYLTSSEEEECIGEAQRSGNLGSLAYVQVRRAIAAMAPSTSAQVERDGQSVEQPAPGAFARVPSIERRAFWEELGPHGRALVVAAFNLANTPSEAARQAAMQSFRLSG